LTFKILKNDLVTVLHRSVVRSAAYANHRNRRVSFKSDVQELLKLLDTKPSLNFVWKDSHHKHRSRRSNNDVSSRTIKTELKQLTDYQTFIVLDLREDIPYHMVFDVKYDLRHKSRLVAGDNWTVHDKEDIYSGVLRMDTVRIGFFLGELYGLSCCACDIGNPFFYGKTK
jgi:hypothetical protein